jgi:septal ring factor EnvC (AmiA/AmiB activator)
MTRIAVRSLAPAVAVALALLAGGCSSDDDSTDETASGSPAASAVASASAELCSSFASLKTDAADLSSTTIDTTKSADEVKQQVDALQGKADKLRDDLNTMMRESNGGPAAAVIGALNQKADALNAQLTIAKTEAQADLGPKITAAQEEIATALEPVTVAVDKLCPSS